MFYFLIFIFILLLNLKYLKVKISKHYIKIKYINIFKYKNNFTFNIKKKYSPLFIQIKI